VDKVTWSGRIHAPNKYSFPRCKERRRHIRPDQGLMLDYFYPSVTFSSGLTSSTRYNCFVGGFWACIPSCQTRGFYGTISMCSADFMHQLLQTCSRWILKAWKADEIRASDALGLIDMCSGGKL